MGGRPRRAVGAAGADVAGGAVERGGGDGPAGAVEAGQTVAADVGERRPVAVPARWTADARRPVNRPRERLQRPGGAGGRLGARLRTEVARRTLVPVRLTDRVHLLRPVTAEEPGETRPIGGGEAGLGAVLARRARRAVQEGRQLRAVPVGAARARRRPGRALRTVSPLGAGAAARGHGGGGGAGGGEHAVESGGARPRRGGDVLRLAERARRARPALGDALHAGRVAVGADRARRLPRRPRPVAAVEPDRARLRDDDAVRRRVRPALPLRRRLAAVAVRPRRTRQTDAPLRHRLVAAGVARGLRRAPARTRVPRQAAPARRLRLGHPLGAEPAAVARPVGQVAPAAGAVAAGSAPQAGRLVLVADRVRILPLDARRREPARPSTVVAARAHGPRDVIDGVGARRPARTVIPCQTIAAHRRHFVVGAVTTRVARDRLGRTRRTIRTRHAPPAGRHVRTRARRVPRLVARGRRLTRPRGQRAVPPGRAQPGRLAQPRGGAEVARGAELAGGRRRRRRLVVEGPVAARELVREPRRRRTEVTW